MSATSTIRLPKISAPPSLLNGFLHCESEAVGVVRANGEYRLVAIRSIAAGQRMFRIEGDETNTPTRYSLQIGHNQHIDLSNDYSAEEILDRYFWRFMNHSCDANSMIHEREVVSLRAIQPWEAVTFNYNTTEWEMAEPFNCSCGSASCLGVIQGLKFLTLAQRERLEMIAPHLSGLAFETSGMTEA